MSCVAWLVTSDKSPGAEACEGPKEQHRLATDLPRVEVRDGHGRCTDGRFAIDLAAMSGHHILGEKDLRNFDHCHVKVVYWNSLASKMIPQKHGQHKNRQFYQHFAQLLGSDTPGIRRWSSSFFRCLQKNPRGFFSAAHGNPMKPLISGMRVFCNNGKA